jgi:peptidoglycan-associated lipoprotein
VKRDLIIATLAIFACSSVFLLVSCAKKQLITKQNEIEAPSREVARVEEEESRVIKEEVTEAAEEEELERPERVGIESLEDLETAEKQEAEAKALQEREAVKFELDPIYFDFDKSSIKEEYRPILEKTAAFLKDNTTLHISIEGNCDERGSPEYNLALGERRADSASRFLVSLGISPDRIEVISYGEERPLALGHSEKAWAQNRRDDFVIIKE